MKYLFWIVLTSALLSFTVVRGLTTQTGALDNSLLSDAHPEHNSGSAFNALSSAIRIPSFPEDTIPVVNGFTQTGNASYYANRFHGRRTSFGTIYHKDSLTAAHRTIKLGTWIKVTNLSNDSVVVVQVTDRMGRSPHILDLSLAGAKQLNYLRKGITKVRIEEIVH